MTIKEYQEIVSQVWLEWDDYKEIKTMEGLWIEDYGIVNIRGNNYHKFIIEDWSNIPHTIYLPVR